MPFIVPFIPLIAAAATATVTGVEIANQPNPNAQINAQEKLLQQQQLQTTQQNELAEQKAIQATLGNAQGQSGGSLTQPGLLGLGASIAGLPGDVGNSSGQTALNDYLGLGPSGVPAASGPGTSPGGVGGGGGGGAAPNITDLIQKLLASQGGGGGGNMVEQTYGLSGGQG